MALIQMGSVEDAVGALVVCENVNDTTRLIFHLCFYRVIVSHVA